MPLKFEPVSCMFLHSQIMLCINLKDAACRTSAEEFRGFHVLHVFVDMEKKPACAASLLLFIPTPSINTFVTMHIMQNIEEIVRIDACIAIKISVNSMSSNGAVSL